MEMSSTVIRIGCFECLFRHFAGLLLQSFWFWAGGPEHWPTYKVPRRCGCSGLTATLGTLLAHRKVSYVHDCRYSVEHVQRLSEGPGQWDSEERKLDRDLKAVTDCLWGRSELGLLCFEAKSSMLAQWPSCFLLETNRT